MIAVRTEMFFLNRKKNRVSCVNIYSLGVKSNGISSLRHCVRKKEKKFSSL